jgi:hypothetical protein
MSETPTSGDQPTEPHPADEAPVAAPEVADSTQSSAAPSPPRSAAPTEMSMGSVLGEAFTLYRRFFTRFFLLALVVFLVLNLVVALAAVAFRNSSGGAGLLVAISFAVTIVGEVWLIGGLVFAVQDVLDGRADDSIGQLLSKATPFLGRLVGAGILAGLGIAVGIVLFVVPGLYLLTIWAVIAPVIVLEGTGVMDAFGRSRTLVRGRFWPVFGVVIVASIISAIAQNVVRLVLSFLPFFLRYWLGGSVAAAVAVPFLALAVTLTYYALRDEKAAAGSQAS